MDPNDLFEKLDRLLACARSLLRLTGVCELRGAGYHTLGEYIEVDSLAERARLMAGLLMALR